ncbi:hypothetical protein GCM10023081_24970 [Arthrobacter ginkgonis]|uniref:Uncharacterized protein n=1 Tax=Arthrobacter ginkgonis TaxID=1630594 RepID=A0ABP7CBV3_9MICC
MLAGQACGVQVPGQRGADALDLVGGDLFAVAGTAEHDAERLGAGGLVGDDGERGTDAERRVVVLGVVGGGAVVDDLVAVGGQVPDKVGAELEPGVVGGDVDAHGESSGEGGECR